MSENKQPESASNAQFIRADFLKHEKEYAEKRLALEFKAAGYLLTAHGAGLVGCLAVLKDYASTPQLKGVGLFVACFGTGFILACIAFLSMQIHHSQVMSIFLDGAPKTDPKWMVYKAHAPLVLSGFVLIGAVIGLIFKFIAL